MEANKSLPLLLGALSLAAVACRPPTPPASVINVSPDSPTTQLVGEGRLSAAPDYLELTVRVQSECFASPDAASRANDEAVARVMALLKSAIDASNPGDGVFSSGGFTQPFFRYTRNNQRVCEGTFQKTATVVMKSSKVAEFPRDFLRIQGEILTGALKQPSGGGAKGITYATLDAPIPRLAYKTREKLEQQALAMALDNARAKFSEAASACGGAGHRIVKFVERSASAGRPIPYERSQAVSGGKTLELDAIWINKLLEVHFALDGECK